MEGFVKSLIRDRNFGFIRANGLEYFFHREDYQGDWDVLVSESAVDRIAVSFEEVESRRGPRAAFVQRIQG